MFVGCGLCPGAARFRGPSRVGRRSAALFGRFQSWNIFVVSSFSIAARSESTNPLRDPGIRATRQHWTRRAPASYRVPVSTLEEIKAATARLGPDDQFELFRWWTESKVFKARQLAALKEDIAKGIDQLDRGQYRTYDDTSLMQLAEEIGEAGRERLRGGQTGPAA